MNQELTPAQWQSVCAILLSNAFFLVIPPTSFGPTLFSLQLMATLVVLSWLPFMHEAKLFSRLPNYVSIPPLVLWLRTCALPCAYALFVELFTGHRRADAAWYSGIWRIYVIIALWIALGVFIERRVRPWWKNNSNVYLALFRRDSVNAHVFESTVGPQVTLAAAVLFNSMLLSGLRKSAFGVAPFSLQMTGTLVVLAWLPYVHQTKALSRLPNYVLLPPLVVWGLACVLPCAYALVVELFTGHRRAGAAWYSGIWRVYVIIAFWIALAVLIERRVRPWWKNNSHVYLAPFRRHSVNARAFESAVDRRGAALERIKGDMVAIFRRKILAQRAMNTKTASIEAAKRNIQSAKHMLKNCSDESTKLTCTTLLHGAEAHHASLVQDIQQCKLQIHDCQLQIKPLQTQWQEALNIYNHTPFSR